MKRSFKRTLALLCALVVCLSLAACGSNDAESTVASAADGGTGYRKFVMAGPSDPGNYLPFNADNSVRQTYSIFFYEYLFDLFGTGDMRPTIASGFERTGEGVYVVKLRQNVHDHNGEPITASDVVFSFE